MYIYFLQLPLFKFSYLFFLSFLSFLSSQNICFVFIALFPTWHLELVLFSIGAFVSLVLNLVDIIFGFLCLVGLSIELYFCWIVLILLMDVCVYIPLF